ncbi:MAG: hypothetical protein LBP59_10980 [Planctomycetaceae bacterium]|jgi:hypothetical protein|nr:hypothetical protein [Planctomycetaceae bacterium]
MSRLLIIGIIIVILLLMCNSSNRQVVPVTEQYNATIATIATVAAYETLTAKEIEPEPIIPVPQTESEPINESNFVLDNEIQTVWDELNGERIKLKLQPFELSSELVEAAASYKSNFNKTSQCSVIKTTSKSPVRSWLNSRRTRQLLLLRQPVSAGLMRNGDTWILVIKTK